ncbi:MAG: YihY/virulence factor BrkB family protein [Thermoguttaceae bacterium]|jgi:membrane protein
MPAWLKRAAAVFFGKPWRVLRKTWAGWERDDGFLLSAAMAYYAAFSLFPLCLVLIAALGFVMRLSAQAQDARQRLFQEVERHAGPWLAEQLEALLAGVSAHAGLGGPIGIITLLLAAIGIFLQLNYMFDKIWGTGGPAARGWLGSLRTILLGRLTAFLMLLAVGGLLAAIFLADIVRAGIRSYVVQLPAGRTVWHSWELAVMLAGNALLFAVLYKTLPKVPIRWRDALAGGAFVSVVWFLGQRLLVVLLIGEGYSAYGVVGSFIAVMLWLYYASATVFLGAEFVRALGGDGRD